MSSAAGAIPWDLYAVMAFFSITIGLLIAVELRWPSSPAPHPNPNPNPKVRKP